MGALVPNGYPVVLRVRPPDPGLEDWWSAYRDLYEVVASIGERHTSSPHRAWFAVWEGHGFATATTHVAVLEMPTFELPDRRFYLLTGPVSAVTQLRYPPPTNEWRNPDLFWPDDRRWYVAPTWTSGRCTSEATTTSSPPSKATPSEIVGFDRPLEIED